MAIIHMETEQVRAVARQLQQTSESIQQQFMGTRNIVNSMDWQGQSRDELIYELEQISKRIVQKAEEAASLGTRLEDEVDEWETADRNSSAGFSENRSSVTASSLNAQVLGLASLPATGTVAVIATTKLQPGSETSPFYTVSGYLGASKYDELIQEKQDELLQKQARLDDIPNRLDGLNNIQQKNTELLNEIDAELTPPKKFFNDILGLTEGYEKTRAQLLQNRAAIDGLIQKYQQEKTTLPQEISALQGEIGKLKDDKPCSPVGASIELSPERKTPVHISGDNRGVSIDITPLDSKNPVVQSIRNGTIVGTGYENGGYGNYVKVLQDDGVVVLYAHLDSKHQFKIGDPIGSGDPIGVMGSTGHSTGTHLHLEFRTPYYSNSDPPRYISDSGDLVTKYNNGTFTPVDYLKTNGCSL